MGKILDKIKEVLWTNFNKNFRTIVERVGKFLIAILQLSIAVVQWLVNLYITEPILATFMFSAYIVLIELTSANIIDVFRKNGNNK